MITDHEVIGTVDPGKRIFDKLVFKMDFDLNFQVFKNTGSSLVGHFNGSSSFFDRMIAIDPLIGQSLNKKTKNMAKNHETAF